MKLEKIKIESGIAIPKRESGRTLGSGRWQILINDMRPGDSVFLANGSQKGGFWAAAKKMNKKTRICIEGSGYRCWLIK